MEGRLLHEFGVWIVVVSKGRGEELLDEHGRGDRIDQEQGLGGPLEPDGPEDEPFDEDADEPARHRGHDQGHDEIGVDVAGEKVAQVGADGHEAAVGEVRELEDVEDEPEPDGLEGVDPAQGEPVEELLEENARVHRRSFIKKGLTIINQFPSRSSPFSSRACVSMRKEPYSCESRNPGKDKIAEYSSFSIADSAGCPLSRA